MIQYFSHQNREVITILTDSLGFPDIQSIPINKKRPSNVLIEKETLSSEYSAFSFFRGEKSVFTDVSRTDRRIIFGIAIRDMLANVSQ